MDFKIGDIVAIAQKPIDMEKLAEQVRETELNAAKVGKKIDPKKLKWANGHMRAPETGEVIGSIRGPSIVDGDETELCIVAVNVVGSARPRLRHIDPAMLTAA